MIEQNISTSESSTKPVLAIDQSLLAACIHCGLCLPACPTYLVSGRETESPRGRIYLLSQWNTGELPFNDELVEHIDSCLGCLGCQTACPSGVQYEKIINQARPHIARNRPFWQRTLMRTVFKYVLPNYALLKLNGVFLRIWQALQIDKALTAIAEKNEGETTQHTHSLNSDGTQSASCTDGFCAPHLIPPSRNVFFKFAQWNAFLPAVPAHKKLPGRLSSKNATAGTIQLFSGCMMDIFYNHVNRAAMNLLSVQNHVVENPGQTCCGALAFHAGEIDIAAGLARRNVELFESTDGPVAVTAAGCGAMLKEYGHLLKDDIAWAARAEKFSSRVVDITEALAAGKFENPAKSTSTVPVKIAYHAACHLAHAQSVRVAPNELLQLLSHLNSEVTLIPLKDAEQCCGSAGIYNLLHPEMALKVLDRKMDNVQATGADIVVSTNPGCLLQLETGVRRRSMRTKIKHLCEVLADYYC